MFDVAMGEEKKALTQKSEPKMAKHPTSELIDWLIDLLI